MKTVTIRLDSLEKVKIPLGFVGENLHRRIIFVCDDAFKEYPNATATITVESPAGVKYPGILVKDGNNVYWDIRDSDVAVDGNGQIQLTFTEGVHVKKEYKTRTFVEKSIVANSPAPDPVEDWVEQANETLEDLAAMDNIAKNAQESDIGKSLSPKTVVDGVVTEWQYTEPSGGTDDYTYLNNKPQIAGVTLSGNKSLTDLGIASTESLGELSGEVTNVKTAIQGKPDIDNSSKTGVDLDVSDENGNVIARLANGHIQTKNFNSAKAPNTSNDSSFADLNVTDEDGNVIVRFGNGGVQTKNFNSADFVGIVGRNKEITDGIYAACRWHQPSASAKQFCILMGTDIHADAVRLGNMVEYLNKIDAIDAGICLGDIAGNTWADDATYYTEQISKTEKPFLTVIGNHDAGAGNTVTTSYTNIADLVAKFITPNIGYADLASGEYPSGKSYYYKDFSSYKIRIIVLNNYEYPSDNDGTNFAYTRGYNCWSQDQIDWFVSVLNSTPSDYGVIIATHFIPTSTSFDKSSIWTSSTMQYSSYSPDTVLASADRNLLADIVNAWINGATLSKTYSYTVTGGSWSGITVDADFTERGEGEFITWIGGHLHMSVIGSIYSYSDQHVYLVDCSGLNAAMQGDTPRKEGTRSEDAICVLSVDRELKEVKLFRIGAHFTKDAIDRLYGKYSYAE